jgi:hypothetical protein
VYRAHVAVAIARTGEGAVAARAGVSALGLLHHRPWCWSLVLCLINGDVQPLVFFPAEAFLLIKVKGYALYRYNI